MLRSTAQRIGDVYSSKSECLFRHDLYSAADFIYDSKKKRGEHHELFPLHILEAANCGVIPLLVRGSVAAEQLKGKGVLLESDDYQGICEGLKSVLCVPGKLKQLKKEMGSLGVIDESSEGELLGIITNLLAKTASSKPKDDKANVLDHLKSLAGDAKHHDVLVGVEDLLLKAKLNAKVKSELFQLKGDACFHLADYDSGSEAYSECLKFDSENASAYRGLGFIAIKGHSHEEAISFFKKALAKKRRRLPSSIWRGSCPPSIRFERRSYFLVGKKVTIFYKTMAHLPVAFKTALIPSLFGMPISQDPH